MSRGSDILEYVDIDKVVYHLRRHGYIVDDTNLKVETERIKKCIEMTISRLTLTASIDILESISKWIDAKIDMLAMEY